MHYITSLFTTLVILMNLLGVAAPAYAQEAQTETAETTAQPQEILLKEGQYLASEVEPSNAVPAGRGKQSTTRTQGNVWDVREERMRLKKLQVIGEQNLRAREIELERTIALKAIEEDAEARVENRESSIAIGDRTAPIDALVNGTSPLPMGGYTGTGYGDFTGIYGALQLQDMLRGTTPVVTPQPVTPPPSGEGQQTTGGAANRRSSGSTTTPRSTNLLEEARKR